MQNTNGIHLNGTPKLKTSNGESREKKRSKLNTKDKFIIEHLYTPENQLKQGILVKNFKNKGRYTGQLSSTGSREGKGLFRFKETQDCYFGDWQNDLFHGNGEYLFANGDRYVGQLAFGMKHGQGSYFYKNSNVFEGEWANDQKCGFGVMNYLNRGERFEGWFYFFWFYYFFISKTLHHQLIA